MPSRHDPRNPRFAQWGPYLLALEMVGVVVLYCLPPVQAPSETKLLCIILAVTATMTCAGYRGMICGDARRTASAVLYLINLILFSVASVTILILWWQNR